MTDITPSPLPEKKKQIYQKLVEIDKKAGGEVSYILSLLEDNRQGRIQWLNLSKKCRIFRIPWTRQCAGIF